MNHNQQENRQPGSKNREPGREQHEREAARARGGDTRKTHTDPAKFNEDLPYDQRSPMQQHVEEGLYREESNPATLGDDSRHQRADGKASKRKPARQPDS